MEQKERENFYRSSTVIVDLGKDALDALLGDDLSKNNTNLVDFINLNQHAIYHLRYNRQRCCQCVNGVLPITTPASRVLHPNQLEILLDKTGQKLLGHNPRNGPPCCCSSANPNLIISNLDLTLLRCLLTNFCNFRQNPAIRQSIDDLVKYRNSLYGHATEARIPDVDYARYMKDLERVLMIIARFCHKESEMKQKLRDAYTRPLDQNICTQYQNYLLSEIQQSKEIEKKITDVKERINEAEGQILTRLQTLEHETDELGQRKRCFVEHAKARIATVDESIVIPDKAMSIFTEILRKNNVVTVVSKPGGGKSSFCLQNARLLQQGGEYTPVVFVNDEVVRNRDLIDTTHDYIYILEDFFGRENPFFNEDVHRNILDMLNSCFKQPSCKSKLIITLRTGQPNCHSILDKHTIFDNKSVVDLDHLFTFRDRKGIFHYHLQKLGISVCSPVYGDKHYDVYDMLPICFYECPKIGVIENYDTSLTMCRAAFIEICQSADDIDIGFPQACNLLCYDQYSIKQWRDNLIKITSKSLVNEIRRIHSDAFDHAMSMYKYSVLVYVAMNGCIDIENVDHDFFKSILGNFIANPFIKKSLLKNATELMEGKYLTRTPRTPRPLCFYLNCCDASFAKNELCGQYFMQHSTITDAVLLSHGMDNDLLPTCENDFFFRYFRPKRYRDFKEISPGVLSSDNEQIARKLIHIFNNGILIFNNDNQILKVGTYLNMVTIQCRNDELLESFFQGLNANFAKPSCQNLFNGLTDNGKMSEIVKIHPAICKTYLIYGSQEIICKFCRPYGWVSEESNTVEVDGFALVVRLFCVLLGLTLLDVTDDNTNDQCPPTSRDLYMNPDGPKHVGKVNIEEQRQIGNFVYEKLIVYEFKSLVSIFLFLLVLKRSYIHPVIVMSFIDGLTNFGERKGIVEEYRRFWDVLVFKYGSIPTILKLCRPVSLIEDDLLLKVDDERLSHKLCSFFVGVYRLFNNKQFNRHVRAIPDRTISLICFIDFSYYVYFSPDFPNLYLEDTADYVFKYGIEAENKTFVSTIYSELTNEAANDYQLGRVVIRHVDNSMHSLNSDESRYFLQFVNAITKHRPYCARWVRDKSENPFENLYWKISEIKCNFIDDSGLDYYHSDYY